MGLILGDFVGVVAYFRQTPGYIYFRISDTCAANRGTDFEDDLAELLEGASPLRAFIDAINGR